MIDLQELRMMAEKVVETKAKYTYETARKAEAHERYQMTDAIDLTIARYRAAVNSPAVITELLDRLESAEKVCRACEAFQKADWVEEEACGVDLQSALAEWRCK